MTHLLRATVVAVASLLRETILCAQEVEEAVLIDSRPRLFGVAFG